MNQAKCTTCGAGLTIKKGDKTCVCAYCQSTNIVENALALGKVEVDVTEDIKRLRENLAIFVQQNSIDEILRVSQKLLDWIPQDFVALYFFGYAKQQQNQPRFLYDFYKEAPLHTEEDLKIVAHHLMRYSELRDKVRVITFFEVHAPKLVKQYEQIHKEREDQEDHYANIPRDIFVCFSSFDVEIAQSVVEELEADGNTCWISTRNLRPEDAENYWNNIENAIRNTSLFVVISSANSMRSKDVHQEIEFAQKHQSRMIEFKIDDAPHNTLFKHVFDGNKWVKGSKESNQSYKNLLQRVFEEKALPSPTPTKHSFNVVATAKPINKALLGGIAGVIVLAIGLFLFMNSGSVDVTLNGSSSLVLSVGETYQELGAVAENSRNEAFPVDIIGTVNASRPGNYSVIYRATDSSGRVVEAERLIQVVDTTAPQITLSGDASKTLILGEFYEDPGASAVDNVDGVVTVSVQGAVNTAVPGTYRIEYSAKDNAGNQSTLVTRTILVRIPTMDDLLSRAFTVITMDINPTIVIFLDASDRVLGVESLNDDAEDVLKDYSYLNQNVDQVIDAVISRSQEYLKDEVILIGVQSTSESKQDLISTRVEAQIERSAVTHQTPITPIIRTLTLNANELRPVLRQEQPTPARQEYVNELVQVGKLPENANVIVNRSIGEISAQRDAANVDNILNDKIPPRIRLLGNPNQILSLNDPYVEFGAIVTDNLEENLEASVTGSVDTSRTGVYVLTYTAKDTAGNEAEPVTRTVTVGSASAPSSSSTGGSSSGGSSSGGSTSTTPPVTPPSSAVGTPSDSVPPVITLNGASSITLEVGSTYNDLGATVTDNVDSGLSANITGVVNTGVIGTYTITYSASDRTGNAATPRTRTIRVVDTTRPTIALNGSSNITLEQGQTYVEQGATVSDNYDQNLTAQISGSINTNTIGTYTITYNATDSSNNTATPVTRTIQVIAVEVVDTIPPVISLNGSSNINHNVGSSFTDPGATALDNKDGTISVNVTGTVNTALLGTYTLQYRATDQADNSSEITRTVIVVDTTPPVITLTGAATITIEVGSVFTDPGSTVTDNYSTNLTASVTGSVNRNLIGTYTLTYSAADSSGNNATQRTRTVNVVDTTKPVITLNGDQTITIATGSSFTDPGVVVTDNYSTNLVATVNGSVNSNVAGTYVITYSAIDSSGNSADTKTRTIIVETVVELAFENSAQVEANKFQFLEQESIVYRFSQRHEITSTHAFSDNIYFPFYFDVSSSDLNRDYNISISVINSNLRPNYGLTTTISYKVDLMFDNAIEGSISGGFTNGTLTRNLVLSDFESPGRYYILLTVYNRTSSISSYQPNWGLFVFN